MISIPLTSISMFVAAETKNSLNTSAISEFIVFPLISEIFWDALTFSEKRGLIAFQNFLLSEINLVSRLLK